MRSHLEGIVFTRNPKEESRELVDVTSRSLTLTIVCYKPSNIETLVHEGDSSGGGCDGPNQADDGSTGLLVCLPFCVAFFLRNGCVWSGCNGDTFGKNHGCVGRQH